jgi:hypothetical protein
MDGESENRTQEEDSRVDLLKAYDVLEGAPDEAEAGTAEEARAGNSGEELIVIEVDVAIVFEDDLDEVAETHRESQHHEHVPEGAMLDTLL